jgi:hypothetical protein
LCCTPKIKIFREQTKNPRHFCIGDHFYLFWLFRQPRGERRKDVLCIDWIQDLINDVDFEVSTCLGSEKLVSARLDYYLGQCRIITDIQCLNEGYIGYWDLDGSYIGGCSYSLSDPSNTSCNLPQIYDPNAESVLLWEEGMSSNCKNLDNDGYYEDEDCNDLNMSINPGAVEIANNNIDENCDGIDLISTNGYNISIQSLKQTKFCNANQINLSVVGEFSNSCGKVYSSRSEIVGSNIKIYIDFVIVPVGQICNQSILPFTYDVPQLPGVQNGQYNIQIFNALNGNQIYTDAIEIGTCPDLRCFASTYIEEQNRILFRTNIKNFGLEVSGEYKSCIYLSLDQNISQSEKIGEMDFASLAVSIETPFNLYIDKSKIKNAPGEYFVIFEVDCDNEVIEINESNTCMIPNKLIISDIDGDGFSNYIDCDDNNPQINPDAPEICDEIDNNCNLQIDEGFLNKLKFFDLDGDDFGDPFNVFFTCAELPFLVLNDWDCDDTNPNINPLGQEIPNNGIDEDCDGEDMTTGVRELANSKIRIYPNPVSDVLNIDGDGKLNIKVSIFDLSGKLVISSNNERTIDVSYITHGSYLLELEDQKTGQKIVDKIIIGK